MYCHFREQSGIVPQLLCTARPGSPSLETPLEKTEPCALDCVHEDSGPCFSSSSFLFPQARLTSRALTLLRLQVTWVVWSCWVSTGQAGVWTLSLASRRSLWREGEQREARPTQNVREEVTRMQAGLVHGTNCSMAVKSRYLLTGSRRWPSQQAASSMLQEGKGSPHIFAALTVEGLQ